MSNWTKEDHKELRGLVKDGIELYPDDAGYLLTSAALDYIEELERLVKRLYGHVIVLGEPCKLHDNELSCLAWIEDQLRQFVPISTEEE
jgi:hypothetical protein